MAVAELCMVRCCVGAPPLLSQPQFVGHFMLPALHGAMPEPMAHQCTDLTS